MGTLCFIHICAKHVCGTTDLKSLPPPAANYSGEEVGQNLPEQPVNGQLPQEVGKVRQGTCPDWSTGPKEGPQCCVEPDKWTGRVGVGWVSVAPVMLRTCFV